MAKEKFLFASMCAIYWQIVHVINQFSFPKQNAQWAAANDKKHIYIFFGDIVIPYALLKTSTHLLVN